MNTLVILLYCLIIFFVSEEASGFADRAAYYIRNVEDNLCITGGPIHDGDEISIHKTGILVASNCSGSSNQQWILNKNGTGDYATNYMLRSQNSTDINKALNAKITGEFIKYFPNPLKIYPRKKNGNYSHLFDTRIKKCYQGMGKNHIVKTSKCDSKLQSQLWILDIVSAYVAPGTVCSSFWSCNN